MLTYLKKNLKNFKILIFQIASYFCVRDIYFNENGTARLIAFSRENVRGKKKDQEIGISRITRDFPVAGVGEQSDPGTTVSKVDSKISVDTPLTEYGRDRIERRRGQIYISRGGWKGRKGRGGASVHLVCIPVCAMPVSGGTVSHR